MTNSAGVIPQSQSYSYHFSEQPAHEVAGGSVKIIDPLTFPIASSFSAAIVTVKPGAMREIHWHPTSDEWTFFISGQGRATLFTAPDQATTFDYHGGDVGYFPQSNSHYIENTGSEDLVFLEVLQADQFTGELPISPASFSPAPANGFGRYLVRPVDRKCPQADRFRHLEIEQRESEQPQEGEAVCRFRQVPIFVMGPAFCLWEEPYPLRPFAVPVDKDCIVL